jgi:hypothetical protein
LTKDTDIERNSETLASDGGGYELSSMRPDQPLPVLDPIGAGNEGEDLVDAVGAELARRAKAPASANGTRERFSLPAKQGFWQGLRSFGRSISVFRA